MQSICYAKNLDMRFQPAAGESLFLQINYFYISSKRHDCHGLARYVFHSA